MFSFRTAVLRNGWQLPICVVPTLSRSYAFAGWHGPLTNIVADIVAEDNLYSRWRIGMDEARKRPPRIEERHPLGHAIVECAKEKGLGLADVAEFGSTTGKGVRGLVAGQRVLVGSPAVLAAEGGDVAPLAPFADTLQNEGCSVVYVSIATQLAGLIAVQDPIKGSAKESVAYFRNQGIDVVMLTGDNRLTAAAVARELGIDRFHAEVLPQDKHTLVQTLQKDGAIVAMVGDGINDAPALAQAQVGVAMGTGTDVAIESADITATSNLYKPA